MERVYDWGGGLKLIQNTDLLCVGTDAVYLANYVLKSNPKTVADFCTGNGIIPVLLSQKFKNAQIYGIEIQQTSADLAKRNVELNGLGDRVKIINDDIKNCNEYFKSGSVDIITCNPPYMALGAGFKNPKDEKAAARHEIYIDINGVLCAAKRILKFGGEFYMVHRTDRLCDVLNAMRTYKIEPKTLKFIHPYIGRAPNLFLVKGIAGAKPSLILEAPEYVRKEPFNE